MYIFSPLEQFEIVPFLGVCVHADDAAWVCVINNADMVCVVVMVEFAFLVWLSKQGLVGFLQQTGRGALRGIQFIEQLVWSIAGRTAQFNLFIVLGFLIFSNKLNIAGLVPWGFCLTVQLVVTQFLAMAAVGGLAIKGVQFLGLRWLGLFIPRNVPLLMLPFLGVIEVISYISRVVSLSVRLFANMVAGHALLHILLGAVAKAFETQIMVFLVVLGLVIPTLLILAVFFLEVGIAFLQSYVFSVLFLIYFTSSCRAH